MRPKSFLDSLRSRELGQGRKLVTPTIAKRINTMFNHVLEDCASLKKAISTGRHDNVSIVVADILGRFLENGEYSAPDQSQRVVKRQQRELFTAMGGTQLLLQLFLPPFAPLDARDWSASAMRLRSEFINEVLVIFRELLTSVPSIADSLITNKHMIFLFTMLYHSPVFDNTIQILEEVLAAREDTFNMGLIPNFHGLVNSFSPRHLAHFCRVLSLVVFEPEDRFILEGSHVLRSLELLQLRRNRISKNCSGSVERNQNLVSN
jgi:hypothetical protein